MTLPVSFNKNMKIQSMKHGLKIEFFTNEELNLIFDSVKNKMINNRTHEMYHRRYYFLMKALLYTGARIEEIVPYHRSQAIGKGGVLCKEINSYGLRPADINLDIGTVALNTLKKKSLSGKLPQRVMPLFPEFKNEFTSYLLATHIDIKSKDPLFPMTRGAVNLYMKKFEEDLGFRIHPHKFRHTFAVAAVLSGVPLNVLQEWMAHSSIFITSIYTQITGMDTSRYMEQMNYENLG